MITEILKFVNLNSAPFIVLFKCFLSTFDTLALMSILLNAFGDILYGLFDQVWIMISPWDFCVDLMCVHGASLVENMTKLRNIKWGDCISYNIMICFTNVSTNIQTMVSETYNYMHLQYEQNFILLVSTVHCQCSSITLRFSI